MRQPIHDRNESAMTGDAVTGTQKVRRHRISHSRLTMPLPPYDIRVRRELAHRRMLLALARHVLRIGSLHVLDAMACLSAALLARQFLAVSSTLTTLVLLVGLVLLGLNGRGAYKPAE